ncbi:putative secondary metabolism biosynthetic enzyme [Microsporum audouinii]
MSHCTPYPSEMRSLTTEIDRLAASRPEGLFAKIPVSSDAEIAWHNITWLQLAKYVSTMSHWIEAHLGPAMENEPVAYMAINDIRYPVFILAAIKTGYNTFQVPDLEYLLQSGPGDAPYEDRFLHKEHKTALILHSSGTTGLPKPVYIKAGALAVITSIKEMPAPEGRRYMHDELFTPKLMVSMMPFFHIMGIISLARAIYHQGPLVLLPAGRPVTADLMMLAINEAKPSAAAFAPSVLEDISNTPNGLEILSTLEYTFYGGAPLSRQCGDIVSKVTNLQAGIGSTEMLHVPSYIPLLPEDWEYFEWSNECGIAMEAAMDGIFELVMKQTFNRENQMIFYNYPGLSEWRTTDLFEKHPTKPGMWRYAGRADGMMTLSNGEKLNPLPFEKSMESHPWVRSALIIGSERFQAGLIIEPQPKQLTVGPREFIDHVWPRIENANAQCPTHAKVWKSMVILATPEKPFIFTSKGSIMRQATYQLYQAEIDQLYAKEKVSNDVGVAEFHGQANSTAVKSLLRETFRAMLHPIQGELQDTTDIFHLGANSLQILQLSNELNRIFHRKSNGRNICPPRVIYGNPSIDRLCEVIMQALNGGDYLAQGITESALSREEKMSAMIHRHTKSLRKVDSSPAGVRKIQPLKHVAILTGSTGSLGTYLLHYLVSSLNFERIYCLNRSADAASSQKQSFRDRGMSLVGFASKVEFITADFSRDRFGLSSTKYQELQQVVDVFIHNAWPVNFNNSLEYFEASAIAGTRHCVDFAVSARYNPHIVFVSSIASIGNWPAVRATGDKDLDCPKVPEEFQEDNCLPLKQGYGEPKHVASCILRKAARLSGARSAIIRVGQLSGPIETGGVWNKSEWVPSLIATSKALGKIPRSLGTEDTIDWVPIDIATQAVLDITVSLLTPDDSSTPPDFFNLVNPQVAEWKDMVHVIRGFYQKQRDNAMDLEPVEFRDWVQALRNIGATTREQIDQYPSVKLLEFFEEMQEGKIKVRFETTRTMECSRAVAGLHAVDTASMERWLARWQF